MPVAALLAAEIGFEPAGFLVAGVLASGLYIGTLITLVTPCPPRDRLLRRDHSARSGAGETEGLPI